MATPPPRANGVLRTGPYSRNPVRVISASGRTHSLTQRRSASTLGAALVLFGLFVPTGVTADDEPGTLDPVQVYGDRVNRGTFSMSGAGIRFIMDAGGGGSGPSGAPRAPTCDQLKRDLIPTSAREWCTGNATMEDLYPAAAVSLLAMVAGDPGYGQQSGLGMLYQFLRMPESRSTHPTRGDAHSAAIRGIANFINGSTTWDAFSRDMGQACFIPQMVETGRSISGLGYVNPATEVCLTAVGVMRLEVTGTPFNADRDRNFLDSIGLGVGAGVSISVALGDWLSAALEAGGFKQGLKAGNSLHAFNALVDSQVQKCAEAREQLAGRGCQL